MEPAITVTELTIIPYLNFQGKAKEAMRFYQSILGGELTMQTFDEAKMAKAAEEKDLIVHASLKGRGFTLMASDAHPSMNLKTGDNISMSVQGHDKSRLTEIFNRLSQGGKIDMPLAKQFWGDTFGSLTDKFGIHWMINIASQPQR